MSLFTQKLFCFALKHNSDAVGGENQSSQRSAREREGMRTVRGFDYCDGLKVSSAKATSYSAVYQFRNAFASHFPALVAARTEN